MSPLNWIRLVAAGVVLLILYGAYNYVTGLQSTISTQADTITTQKGTIKSHEDAAKDVKHTEKIVGHLQETKVEIQYVDREVIKKVLVYRDRIVDRFKLNDDWVRAYNDSIQELTTSDSTSRSDGAGSEVGKIVDDATALDVITANNRRLVLEIKKYETLKQWAKAPLEGSE